MSGGDDPSLLEPVDYVFIAVHGTFSTTTRWAAPKSKLNEVLTKILQGRRWRLEQFQWSSSGFFRSLNNSHGARVAAAERFRQRLSAIVAKEPRSRIFIFAHSHGGNAVLYALRQAPVMPQLAGIVLLATPLLLVTLPEKRFFDNLLSTTSTLFRLLWMVVAVWMLLAGSRLITKEPTQAERIVWCLIAGWLIGWEGGNRACATLLPKFVQWLRKELDTFREAATSSWAAYPCFCAEVERDEAIIVLTILGAIRRLQRFSTGLRSLFDRIRTRLTSDRYRQLPHDYNVSPHNKHRGDFGLRRDYDSPWHRQEWYRQLQQRDRPDDFWLADVYDAAFKLSGFLLLFVFILTCVAVFISGTVSLDTGLYLVIVSAAPPAIVLVFCVVAYALNALLSVVIPAGLAAVLVIVHGLWTGLFAGFYGFMNPALFGWSHIVAGFFSSLYVSRADIPTNVTLKRYNIRRAGLSLRHSSVYSHDPALHDVADWISGKL